MTTELLHHPFFAGLREEEVQRLAPCELGVSYDPDTLIFETGGQADCCYLVNRGNVALEVVSPAGPPLVVETVDDGGLLGWSWLIPPHRWQFDARAVSHVEATRIGAECLRAAMAHDPSLAAEVTRRLAEVIARRLHHTRLQLLDLYGQRS